MTATPDHFTDSDESESLWRFWNTRAKELLARAEAAEAERDALLKASEEVIDRWDTPAWKDVEPTAAVINRLRARLRARTLSGDKS